METRPRLVSGDCYVIHGVLRAYAASVPIAYCTNIAFLKHGGASDESYMGEEEEEEGVFQAEIFALRG